MSTVPVLLKEAMDLMRADPARAAVLCRAALQAEPSNLDAGLLLSEALRSAGDLTAARDVITPLAAAHPRHFGAQRQLGVILSAIRAPLPASIALNAAAQLNPKHPTIWRDLADELSAAGDLAGAHVAYARHAGSTLLEPRLAAIRDRMRRGEIEPAIAELSRFLGGHPTDVAAVRLLAEAHSRAGQNLEAEAALRRVIELAPSFSTARHQLGQFLIALGRAEDAITEARNLLKLEPRNPGSRRLLASAYNAHNDYAEAAEIYRGLLAEDPSRGASWTSLGHILKTMGETEEAIEAYRKAIALGVGIGDAYWGLANLKTAKLTDDDMSRIRAQLNSPQLSDEDRVSLFYTLGKALEQRGEVDAAFEAFASGAAVRTVIDPHDPKALTEFVDAAIAQQTAAFFQSRGASGDRATDPIFVLGLPRSGSTLVEQILASHSEVEGTMELSDLQNIAREIGGLNVLHERLAASSVDALAEAGATYIRTTASRRKLGRAFFIDKMPNNWTLIGLIHLILPNAKIIDTRRHPMACGWSCFKQHFPLGQGFSYNLDHIGRYYSDYARLLDHYDRVLPGRVHRVIHEELVADPEMHIRALLDYCGLPFEERCLRPHETRRAVHTASSEQVRQPINAKALEEWRAYEAHLGPLKVALGALVDSYPPFSAPAK